MLPPISKGSELVGENSGCLGSNETSFNYINAMRIEAQFSTRPKKSSLKGSILSEMCFLTLFIFPGCSIYTNLDQAQTCSLMKSAPVQMRASDKSTSISSQFYILIPQTKTITKASTSHAILIHKAGCTDEVTNYRLIFQFNAD